MTTVQMAKMISQATGYPEKMVRQILDVQSAIILGQLNQRNEVVFSRLFRISALDRTITVLTKEGRETIKKIILQIRPVKGFRKELNSWTNILLPQETST